MHTFFRSPTQVETTLSCPQCEKKLTIMRNCSNAYMYCNSCKESFDLNLFIKDMDDAMEIFLENLYVDRV